MGGCSGGSRFHAEALSALIDAHEANFSDWWACYAEKLEGGLRFKGGGVGVMNISFRFLYRWYLVHNHPNGSMYGLYTRYILTSRGWYYY